MDTNRILGLPDPTVDQEAATKAYADTHGMQAHENTHTLGQADEIDSALAIAAMAALTHNKIWQGSAGNRPVEIDLPALGPTIVRKAADKTLNNVAVLENDNHLLMAVAANEIWQIDIFLLIRAHSVTPDLKIGFSYPVDCLIDWGGIGSGKSLSSYSWGVCLITASQFRKIQTGTLSVGTDNDYSCFKFSLIVANGANSGNINLQWCQHVANASDTIVQENSCLIAHQLA
ncbi:hypothetical protein ES703_117353 [subsurface metagenome]